MNMGYAGEKAEKQEQHTIFDDQSQSNSKPTTIRAHNGHRQIQTADFLNNDIQVMDMEQPDPETWQRNSPEKPEQVLFPVSLNLSDRQQRELNELQRDQAKNIMNYVLQRY